MILALIRYYWHVLKYGNPLPTQEPNPVYGREELSRNQHWYGFTALGLVMGITLSASIVVYFSMDKRKVDNTIYCPISELPLPQPSHTAHAKGELSLGTTPVRFLHFPIPKPSTIMDGIRKDVKVRDPEGDDDIKDWKCERHFPDSLDSKIKPLHLPPFELPEWDEYETFWGGLEGEPHCPCDTSHSISDSHKVDEEPMPVNLNEVKRLIGYPQILRDAGVVGGHEIKVRVSKEGIYDSHRTEVELHPIMTKQIDKHIAKLIFTPAIRNGQPVAYHITIPFRFCVFN